MNARNPLYFFFLAALVIVGVRAEEQRLTTISAVHLNGTIVPTSLWSSIAIDTASIITVDFICREGISTTGGVRYNIELDNGVQRSVTKQYENSKTLIGLSPGHYSLVVRAQSNSDDWNAVPTSLQFVVDPVKATAFVQTLSETTTNAGQPWWKSSIVLFSVIGVLVCVIALLLVMRSMKPGVVATSTTQAPPNPAAALAAVANEIKDKKTPGQDSKLVAALQKELLDLRKDNLRLNNMVTDLSRRTSELNDQNSDLHHQVERALKVKHELEDLQRQKDEVFAIIIHDIKNPASLIKNLVDLLRGYDLNSSETQEVMQDIVETTTKIVSLSQELSRVMAMDQADISLDFELADPSELVESVCRRNSAAAEKKGISIKYHRSEHLQPGEFDPQKIEEVVDNLISNAIKFSLPGTNINVSVKGNDEYWSIDVQDQGLGMSPEDTQKAFQRGMKLSARPTGDEPSSGLGLWIVKRLVEAHKGRVSVKSDLGLGTTFTVTLPYSPHSVQDFSSLMN